MKLINYRCPDCGAEYEELYRTGEPIPDQVWCDCRSMARRYDFKNNGQRYQYMDRGDGTNLAYEDV